jgi:polysaccharide biosynthesis protein PslJ
VTVSVSIDNSFGAGLTPDVQPSGLRTRGDAVAPEVESGREWTRGAPVTILRVYAVLLVLIPPTQIIGPLGAVGTPATVLALIALPLWGVGVLAPGEYLRRTVVPVRVVVGLLVGTTLLGYAVLHVRYVPAVELLASDRALLQVLSWAGVALLAAEGLRDRHELYSVLRTLVVAVACMSVVGLLQFRFGIDLAAHVSRIPGLEDNADLVSIQDRAGFRRPAGTATHPIEFGCVIAMTLPIALHLARFDIARSPMRRWLPVAAIVTGIPVAISRSAVLAAVIGAVVIFAGLDARLRPRALGVAAGFIVVTYATTPGLLGTLGNLFVTARSDSSVTLRTDDYASVGEYIQQSPLLGRGPGTFIASRYIILDNQYLLSAIEVGFVGLSVVICYLLMTAFLGRGARHRTKDPAIRDLGQAMAATSLASAMAAFSFDGFSFLIFAGFLPLCLGAAGALWKMTRTADRQVEARSPGQSAWQGGFQAPPSRPDPSPRAEPGRGDHGEPVVDDVGVLVTGGGPVKLVASVVTSPAQTPLAEFVGGVRGSATWRSDSHRRTAVIGAGVGFALLGGLALGVGGGGGEDQDAAGVQVVATPPLVPTTTSTTALTSGADASQPSAATATRPAITAMARPASGPTIRPLRTDTEVAVSSRPSSTRFPLAPAAPASPTTSPSTAGPTVPTTPPPRPPTSTTAPPTTTTTAPPTTTTTAPPTTTTTAPPTTATVPPDPEPPPPP